MTPQTADDAWPLILRLVREEGRRHVRGYAVAVGCMLLVAVTTALSAYLMKDVINKIFIEKAEGSVAALAIAVVLIYAVKGAATYGHIVALSQITNAIVARNQLRLFAQYLNFDMTVLGGTHSAELVNRFQTGAASIAQALNMIVTSIGRDVFTVIGLASVMVLQDPLMSIGAFVIVPPAIYATRLLVRRIKKVRRKAYHLAGEILETLQEALQGIRVVKAYRLEQSFVVRMAHATDTARRNANKLAAVAAQSNPVMETLGGFAIAFVIFYGGYRVIHGGQSPGEFFSFIAALLLAYEPAKRVARLNIDLNASLIGVRLLFDTLDAYAADQETRSKPALVVSEGDVLIDQVEFGYAPGDPVIRGVTLRLEPGKTTALVGESGGGKSTLVALLARFYVPQYGGILIDGQEVRSVSLASLRDQIAIVSQETFLFGGTVRDNIAIGRADASEADIIAAALAANAHGFIEALPDGYDTAVGERGASLSGGQRQRIAIARAVLKDAPIILLDEATAALDNESERDVQAALKTLSANKTTLVIAHRLNTVRDADVIHVMEGGRIIESGTHMALLAAGGRYRALYATMSRAED